MRVLVVVSGNHAQVAPFVTEQVEALRQVGCEVELFCVTGHGPLGYLQNLKPLKAAIRRFQPDIVHAHYGLCGLLCTLQHKVPVVVTYHGSDINNPAMLRFSRPAMHRAVHNIFVSKKLRKKGLEVSKSQSLEVFFSVIPCGVDSSIFHPMDREEACQVVGLEPDKHYILFAGAFDNEVKNPELAKEAFALLISSLTDDITISQSEQKRTEKYLDVTPNSKLDCKRFEKNAVHLLELKGYSRTEVAALMSAVDCLLMTSHSEGSPQVVKEALACGCPVVSVDVGDVAEQIEGTDCGVIVDRTPKAIAKAMSEQLENPHKINCKELIKQFDNHQIATRIIEIYNSIITYTI